MLTFQFQKVDPKSVSGFTLAGVPFPTIGINQRDSIPARIFTLVHEFCHGILNETGICEITPVERGLNETEVFCNYVSGAVLLPEDELNRYLQQLPQVKIGADIEPLAQKLSNRFKTSTHVAARRLLITGTITKEQYERYLAKIHERYKNSPVKEDKGGGDFYKLHLSRLSKRYLKLVFEGWEREKITTFDALRFADISALDVLKT
ncbi:MAG: ImmA/IrrE family metallo-endopeptidase [Promethearchaeota archaeon]